MKKRDFTYITREAYNSANERREKFNISDEDFQEDRNEMVVEAIAQNVKEIVECTNASGYQEQIVEGIVKGLTGSHRYLQSEFMTALTKALTEYGKSHTDGRNEHAVKASGRMAAVANYYEIEPSDINAILARR